MPWVFSPIFLQKFYCFVRKVVSFVYNKNLVGEITFTRQLLSQLCSDHISFREQLCCVSWWLWKKKQINAHTFPSGQFSPLSYLTHKLPYKHCTCRSEQWYIQSKLWYRTERAIHFLSRFGTPALTSLLEFPNLELYISLQLTEEVSSKDLS